MGTYRSFWSSPNCQIWLRYTGGLIVDPCIHACVLCHFHRVQLFVTLWTVACQASLSVHGILQARSVSRLPCILQGYLLDPGTEPVSPELAGRFFTTESLGKAQWWIWTDKINASVWLPFVTFNIWVAYIWDNQTSPLKMMWKVWFFKITDLPGS